MPYRDPPLHAEEMKAAQKRYRDKNKDLLHQKAKAYREANRERIRARNLAYQEVNKDRYRHLALMQRYGMSLTEFDAMKAVQNGRCAICDHEPEQLHVDHDHETGRVRGLLCPQCNVGLGSFQDSAETMSRAVYYLLRTANAT